MVIWYVLCCAVTPCDTLTFHVIDTAPYPASHYLRLTPTLLNGVLSFQTFSNIFKKKYDV